MSFAMMRLVANATGYNLQRAQYVEFITSDILLLKIISVLGLIQVQLWRKTLPQQFQFYLCTSTPDNFTSNLRTVLKQFCK